MRQTVGEDGMLRAASSVVFTNTKSEAVVNAHVLFALVPPVLVSVAACPVDESQRSIPPPPATLPLRLWRLEAQAIKHTLRKVILSCDIRREQKALTTGAHDGPKHVTMVRWATRPCPADEKRASPAAGAYLLREQL